MEPLSALATVASVAPKAWQAAKFTLEHVWPWAKEPTNVLDRLIPGRREKRLMQALRIVADAHRPEDSVRVIVRASPAQGHRASRAVLGKDVRFSLCVVNVSPFAIRPHEIVDLRMSIHFSGKWVCGCRIRNRSITAEFLEPGKEHALLLEEPLEWTTDERDLPEPGKAAQLDVTGILRLLAPWSVEYGEMSFQDNVWIQVTI